VRSRNDVGTSSWSEPFAVPPLAEHLKAKNARAKARQKEADASKQGGAKRGGGRKKGGKGGGEGGGAPAPRKGSAAERQELAQMQVKLVEQQAAAGGEKQLIPMIQMICKPKSKVGLVYAELALEDVFGPLWSIAHELSRTTVDIEAQRYPVVGLLVYAVLKLLHRAEETQALMKAAEQVGGGWVGGSVVDAALPLGFAFAAVLHSSLSLSVALQPLHVLA